MQKIQFSHTQVPRRPCSPEPHNYVLWHFLDSFCLLQCVKWHKCLSWSEKGSNVNDCKKWGTSGRVGGGGGHSYTTSGQDTLSDWSNTVVHQQPALQQLRFVSTKRIVASRSMHRSVLGRVKNTSTTYLKQRFISVTCWGEGHKSDVTYGQNLKWW